MTNVKFIDNIKLGRHLSYLRNNAKMTQKELATRLNLTHQQIQKYEKGSTVPTINRLLEITNILNEDINDLLHSCRLGKISNKQNKWEHICVKNAEDKKYVQLISNHFSKIKDKLVKSEIVSLVKSLSKN
ncbi:MAG: helix-turn-helix transcriptional regulator [Alphaproteobacteria bacterium]|nr:helix-turn-helix transcriptional regulator [Rickettsiales bacterium]